jgi:predicted PurR-regulated permease PerM
MKNADDGSHERVSDTRTRARILVISLGVLITIALLPFVTGFLGAAVCYVVFVRVHSLLAARVGQRAAALLTTITAAMLIVLPGMWLAMTIVGEGPGAISALERGRFVSTVSTFRIGAFDVGAAIATASTELLAWLSRAFLQLISGALRAIINLVIALFGLYFLLVAPPRSWTRVTRYLPFSAKGVEMLRQRFYRVTEATLFGTALVAVLQGGIVGVGFAVVGLPDATLWGVITAIASVLPVLGSALVWFPAVLVLLVEGRFGGAVVLTILGAGVASNIDNVARLAVNRRVSGLHPMLTLVGAFAGVRLLGIAGVLLGPLALSYFFELARLYEDEHGGAENGAIDEQDEARGTLVSAGR